MDNLSEHYGRLLGLDDSWEVADVSLAVEEKRVVIELRYRGGKVKCAHCGEACSMADHGPERGWRHLDTMQFETILRARVPRARCAACGVKTIAVAWAEKYSRYTLLFEAFAIEVLLACSNVKRAAELLGLDWGSVHGILERAVRRGLAKRNLDEVKYVGLDEKSFRRGHNYISLLTDLQGSRVLEVTEGRDEAAADALWSSLSADQLKRIDGVAMDMWAAYEKSATSHATNAEIVHDRFHISKHLNEAVDQVRRQEHKALKKTGDETLTGSKQLWLFNPENLGEEQWLRFEPLQARELKTSRAWAIKEHFRWFWEYRYAGNARKFFDRWYSWAIRSRLPPVKKKAKMLKRHLDNLLTYFRHSITNSMSEGFNSKIQGIKSAARGFRAFENYRTRILFYCGGLDLRPDEISH
jgi:transposase